ncbi:SDR family NAD(P)-dependent oxidoreductase [Streptomyces spongiae]|nr:SDR family oxidoreductase [Streptomyces spongiae]
MFAEPAIDLRSNLFDVTGKRTVVTGASRGIGRALALAFAAQGAQVFAVARSADGLAETRQQSAGYPGSLVTHQADLRHPDQIEGTVAAAVAELGGIDILVNNAGYDVEHTVEETSIEEWNDVIDLNLRSTFLLCKAASPHLKEGGGKVVNIASMLGHIAIRGDVAYIASKHGVVGLTRALALDWARSGVNVNAVGPGFVKTDMLASALEDEAAQRYIKRQTPLGRWAVPEEMAGAVLFLASAASDFMTGQMILVDGGVTAQ